MAKMPKSVKYSPLLFLILLAVVVVFFWKTQPALDGGALNLTAGETSSPSPEDGDLTLLEDADTAENADAAESAALAEDGSYTSKEDVCAYLIAYGHLPSNFITKKEAQAAGWEGGSLEPYCPGKCIGGDYFGNYEGKLPSAKGRTWTECDIDTLGASSRGKKRLVFSNDGLIYYSGDHYESFELLYGEP
jgi:guanyl-specific ribonuclease Sa